MKKKPPVLPFAVLVIANTVQAAMLFGRDEFVIRLGIRTYGAIRTGSALTVLASAVWAGLSVWAYLRAKRRQAAADHEAYLDGIAAEKKDLDEAARDAMYKELADFGRGKWSGMDGIGRLIRQLDSMNEYQAEMGRLLDQTDYLKDKPAEIVQKVENSMYVNVRKLLNYMRIVQTKDPGIMRSKIAECEEKNAALLKKTDDFVVAVVSYVNGDIAVGEEENARKSVDEYMYVVLQAIELPETRLQ